MPRSKRERPNGICTYCGRETLLTKDHIPPNNLFVRGTIGRITVPACEICNTSYKLDDEYFRLIISSGHDPNLAPRGSDVTLEAIAKLGAPEKTGLRKMMFSRMREAPVFTPAGLYLGEGTGIHVDGARLFRVLRRVLRGLVFHHFGLRLIPTYEPAVVWLCDDLYSDPDIRKSMEPVLAALRSVECVTIGGHVFSYRFVAVGEHRERSAWHLCFFEHYESFGVIRHTMAARTKQDC